MIILKIILWIILIILILILLAVVVLLAALSVKLRVKLELCGNDKRFELKYGFIPLKIYPEKFEPEAAAKRKAKLEKLKQKHGPKLKKLLEKLKAKLAESKEKSDIKASLKSETELKSEEESLKSEEERLKSEYSLAEGELKAAEEAEKERQPLPEVTDYSSVTKLEYIKARLNEIDYEGAYFGAKNYLSSFDFDTLMELLNYIKAQSGKGLRKVLRRSDLRYFNLGILVGGDDAAEIAIETGNISGVVFPALGKLSAALGTDRCRADVSPDFLAPKTRFAADLDIAMRPLYIVTPLIGALLKSGLKLRSFHKKALKNV